MQRECTRCHRPFTREDFVKDESKGLEADRKAAGLKGVYFHDYRCPDCGTEAVFLDVSRLDGETDGEYRSRRETLEAGVKRVQAEAIEVVVVAKGAANLQTGG